MKTERGFTLIELLIVIVELGILAGIVTFAVGSFRDSAQTAACSADAHQLATANGAYVVQHGHDAASIDDLRPYLSEAPSSGVTFSDGVVDTSGCGVHVLAATPSGTYDMTV